MSELNLTHSNGNQVKLTTPDTLTASKTFKLPGTDGSGGQVLQTDGSGALSFAPQAQSNRRLNYNGSMMISQRGDGTGHIASIHSGPDRYLTQMANAGTWSISQDSDVPDGYGFEYSKKWTCTATSSHADRYMKLIYRMEGFDSMVFNYGTANAKPCTLSFWVKCKKAGNIQVNFENEQNPDRGYQVQQTINVADTWEKKVVTITGDTQRTLTTGSQKAFCFDIVWTAFGTTYNGGTPSAAWSDLANNQRGTHCDIDLCDSTSNYINITGIQLELGVYASDFEHVPYADELARCQRYCQKASVYVASGTSGNNNIYGFTVNFMTEMRAAPTLHNSSGINGTGSFSSRRSGSETLGNPTIRNSNTNSVTLGHNTGQQADWLYGQVLMECEI